MKWVGGPISRKKRYVTLEWPLLTEAKAYAARGPIDHRINFLLETYF